MRNKSIFKQMLTPMITIVILLAIVLILRSEERRVGKECS